MTIALDSSPGRRRIDRIQIIIPLAITTTYQRGTTSLYDRHPATAGIYHALTTTRELSRGHQTSYIQWKDEESERIYQCGSVVPEDENE